MLTEEQKKVRATGIGGSEAAAVLGVNPWKTALDVYLEKVGLVEEEPMDRARKLRLGLGNETEAAVLRLWAEDRGIVVEKPRDTVRHERLPWMVGSFDGVIVGRREGAEAKMIVSYDQAERLGEEGTDEALEEHVVQARHYLEVSGFDRWHIIYGVPRKGILCYVVEPHREFADFLIETERAFWHENVLARVPPPAEETKRGREALARLYPTAKGEELVEASAEVIAAATRYDAARAAAKAAEAEKEGAASALQQLIKDGPGFWWGSPKKPTKATWKNKAGSTKTDWEAIARSLFGEVTGGGLIETSSIFKSNTRITAGSRSLYVSDLNPAPKKKKE